MYNRERILSLIIIAERTDASMTSVKRFWKASYVVQITIEKMYGSISTPDLAAPLPRTWYLVSVRMLYLHSLRQHLTIMAGSTTSQSSL